MALYHKYRPQTLDELVGQEFVRMTLQSALDTGKVAHAYLFFGSRGTGKTSTARILAREILLSGISPNHQETALKQMESGSFVDLIEIDGASNRKIEHARALIEKIQFAPTFGTKKVYIIDEVHMLTKEAFNALLKTIEEPPAHAYFLLATTELHKVPETIRSRCQTFTFQRFSPEQIAGRLAEIAGKEGIEFEHDALLLIAKKAMGGMRDAIGFFEQSAAAGKVSLELLHRELGIANATQTAEFFGLLSEGNTSAAIEFIGQIAAEGHPLTDFCEQFLEFLREKLITAITENTDPSGILELIDLFDTARRGLRDAPIPTLPIEIAIVRATLQENAPAETKWSLFGSGKKSEQKPSEKVSTPASPPVEPKKPENSPPEKTSAESEVIPFTPENLTKNWLRVLGNLDDIVAKAALKNSGFEAASDTVLRFTFSAGSWQKQIEDPTRFAKLLNAVHSVFGNGVSIECATKSVILEPTEPVGSSPSDEESATAEMLTEILGVKTEPKGE